MNKNYGLFGLALQANDSTPASTPQVLFAASEGSDGMDANTSTDGVRLTIGGRDTTVNRYISGSENTFNATTLAFADVLGLVLKAALGEDTVTGSAAPYTHDIKGGESIPAVTVWQQVGASNAAVQRMDGAKVDELTISLEGTQPPAIEMSLAGTKMQWLPATTMPGGTFDPSAGWYLTAGAEVLFSLADGTPVAVPATVDLQSLSIAIANNLEASTRLGEVDPARQTEGAADVTVDVSGTTSDTSLYRQVKTGSASGTELASTIVTGSLQVTLAHSAEDWELVIKLPAIPWTIEPMQVDPEGGNFELSLSTEGALAVDGSACEFIIQNAVASY